MGKLEETIAGVGPLDSAAMAAAKARQDTLTKPLGALGRLEELSIKVAGITGQALPRAFEHPTVIVMAGDHGITADGVSLYPAEVTPQMVYNFLNGGAGINVLARHVGAKVVVVDVGVAAELAPHPGLVNRKVAPGTANFAVQPAMTPAQARQALEAGIEVAEGEIAAGADILATGDMGIGNTTPSSAIVAAITGEPVAGVTGRGTGLDDAQLHHKIAVIEAALRLHQPDADDAMDVLCKVGGLEIGGLAGVILAGAAHRVPIVVDGFISGAAALIAAGLCPAVKPYLIAAHLSVEHGHRAVMRHLGLVPLLDLNMRLGEGTGAALAISIVSASVKVLREMATFGEAGVSEAAETAADEADSRVK
ncbi:MAG: nicotinate-nucleotide--dimethylbenzimidazole phosphoribosyltransferase [Bacteroidetes bacterium]|nr:nicotinate-nucleotide--dimethylbenzimidazole phosphoribosyltransferase [Bacteroidota bacterium]MCL5027231.1 nicotinate-nucleotide--dimethylbenzimidazole phosphoribosyltransferase [Chloroflexota bacterium]